MFASSSSACPSTTACRDRVFAEDSLIWKVNRESVLLLGGPAAAILQIAHPIVARGVAAHSHFRSDPLGRLERTLEAVYTVIFGSRDEAAAMKARVLARHAPVKGANYSAFDPEAQLWVLATLIQTAIGIYTDLVGSLAPSELAQYYREIREFGTYFGLEAEYGPATWESFQNYYEEMEQSALLGSEPVSREIAAAILVAPQPWWLNRGQRMARFLAADFLPAHIRSRLGLAYAPGEQAAFSTTCALIRCSIAGWPDALRYVSPYRRYRYDKDQGRSA